MWEAGGIPQQQERAVTGEMGICRPQSSHASKKLLVYVFCESLCLLQRACRGRVEGVTSLLTPCCGASFVSDGAIYVRVAVHKLPGCSVPDSHLTVCHDLQSHAIISSVYVLQDQTQFPDLRSKRLYPLNHLPGPGCAFM